MKFLFSCLTFVFLSMVTFSTSAEPTGKCCQLEPGPKICGYCAKSQCGGKGDCKKCNKTSVFQGEPKFKSCMPPGVKMCTYDLFEEECLKWKPAAPGKNKKDQHRREEGATTIGGRPIPGGGTPGTPKICLQYGSVLKKTIKAPCNTIFINTNPKQKWVKR